MAEYNINPLLNIHKGGKYKNMIYINSYAQVDQDAKAFIDALNADPAGALTSAQEQYIKTLVYDYKASGLWNKRKVIYPMIGGTAFKHKFNLKDPRDVDGAYRLNFIGGWTHDASGALPNGTTGYADTSLAQNYKGDFNLFLGYYSFTNNATGSNYLFEIGARPTVNVGPGTTYLIIKLPSGHPTDPNVTAGSLGGSVDVLASPGASDTRGWFSTSRISTTSLKVYRNSTLLATNTTTESTSNSSTQPFYIGALNNAGSVQFYTYRGCSFSVIGDGVDDTDQAIEAGIIQAFQTSLGRNFS